MQLILLINPKLKCALQNMLIHWHIPLHIMFAKPIIELSVSRSRNICDTLCHTCDLCLKYIFEPADFWSLAFFTCSADMDEIKINFWPPNREKPNIHCDVLALLRCRQVAHQLYCKCVTYLHELSSLHSFYIKKKLAPSYAWTIRGKINTLSPSACASLSAPLEAHCLERAWKVHLLPRFQLMLLSG